ncbi:MAG: molybdopterin cofactor-binding domain-containing protein [Acidobacteriota bacterium]|nr:molybdopterin cofactor-binding domain-containing protein [Acidobacteriota bacterium]
MMSDDFNVVGKSERRVDAVKLALGKPAFVDDIELPGMLHAKILHSPHAHARIVNIDASRARQLPGVAAVLTYRDVKRIPFATAGQGHPEPSPYDTVMLDNKVRYVGDRVAVVAAESLEVARQALQLIDVEYEILPAIFDPQQAMQPGAPIIHDEPDCSGVYDPQRNLIAHLHAEVGNVAQGFAQADHILEREYRTHYVQQASIEPHIAITYLDEDDRLIIRTSTQVPFHVRRIVARVLDIPVRRIRVIKPRIGGGFGGKQEILIEDLCGALTLLTRRPVRLEYTRAEELTAARTRHPQIIRLKTGVTREGRLTAIEMNVLENGGAYGTHSLTVMSVTGSRSLSLYRCPNIRFEANAVYTNLPVAGAFRGYGAPQGFFALESHMDELAELIGMDPIEFRKRNVVKQGDETPIAEVLGEGREGYKQIIRSYGLDECIERGMEAIGWKEKRQQAASSQQGPGVRRGVGVALALQASGIPGVDMGAASIKMNEDGSFNLLVGATDIGTGADTVLAQIAAEELSVPVERIIMYSSDTDFTPFDPGAYASSTTYISGGAVKKAAVQVKQQILEVASRLLEDNIENLRCEAGRVMSVSGQSVSYEEICLSALYQRDQFQIMAVASHMSYDSPPPFAATFAEVEVDTETGVVRVVKIVSAIDCGIPVNPQAAEGQIEGAVTQALGFALTEDMPHDGQGRMLNTDFKTYRIFTAMDMPEIIPILVKTYEPTGPFGAKAIAEIPINGPAPAIANAIANAVGVRLRDLPFTPEKVWRALHQR